MQAFVQTKRGKGFSTMSVQQVDLSPLEPQQLRLKMSASRVNPVDHDLLKGFPGLRYAKVQTGGVDGSGVVEAVGDQASGFAPGDRVLVYRPFSDFGTWAEHIHVRPEWCAILPKTWDMHDAGSIALPLLTAYEALLALDAQPGEQVLIQGAGGGVGFQAVQLAHAMGLRVIANASSRDRAALEALGTERILDYKQEAFDAVLSQAPPAYVLDLVGGDTLLRSLRLASKRVVSTTLPNLKDMHKTGVRMPAAIRGIVRLMNLKYERTARRAGVSLIGQVTGPNGKGLQAAVDLAGSNNFTFRTPKKIAWPELASDGLRPQDVGKTLALD